MFIISFILSPLWENSMFIQEHAACSESFYRNALLEDLQLDQPGLEGNETQSKMLEILKRIDSDQQVSPEDEEEDQLFKLTEEQIGKLSQDQLLSLLTKEQIEEFERKIRNLDLDSDLIASTINTQFQDPWWLEYSDIEKKHQENGSENEFEKHSFQINLVDHSLLLELPDQINPQLIYHVFSLLLGYVCLIRQYGVAKLMRENGTCLEDDDDLLVQLPTFFPILFDNQLRLGSISECFSLMIKNLPTSLTTQSIRFLIKDLKILLFSNYTIHDQEKKALIVEISSSESSALSNPPPPPLSALALSDLYHSLKHLNQIHQIHHQDLYNKHLKIKSFKPILKKVLYFISFLISSKNHQLLNQINKQLDHEEFDHPDSDHHHKLNLVNLNLKKLS